VKTRLGERIGNKEAVGFYTYCTRRLLGELGKLRATAENYIYYTPDDKGLEIQSWLGSDFNSKSQGGGGLGSRLRKAFRQRFRAGARKVIAIATDVPDIAALDIEEAIEALDTSDIVIGPCNDGGYYLIGMNKFHKTLFSDISWSTEWVYGQTLATAQGLGLKVHNLRTLDDIDTEADYNRWKSRLNVSDDVVGEEEWQEAIS
jgi:rSAM/selenodomain-associated transferase 1